MLWFCWITGVGLALVWTFSVLQAALNHHRMADITQPAWDPPQDTALPSLTIVVPARDEAAAVEPALRSLLHLDYPNYQVIAVNDRSTDETGRIMQRLASDREARGRLRVLHVQNLPEGWLGKTHAMWLGAQQTAIPGEPPFGAMGPNAASDWILFTDADCVFRPDALRRAMLYATKTAIDHLVVFPTAITASWGERMMISFPQVSANLAIRHWKVRDPDAKDSIGVGAFNLIRRAAYEAVGTYEKLRLAVVDDLKLGEAVKAAGLRQDVVFGPGLVSLRWAVGAMGVVANLEKNLFAFFRFRISLALAACALLFTLCMAPFIGLILAPGWSRAGFAVAVAMIAGLHAMTARVSRISPLIFITFPLGAALFLFAVLQSAFLALRAGGVTWRGTKYSLKELRKGSG
ncbi:MAG: glycosyltransferase [Acidobacteriia bacterium]|nr:glycosyltransferase [Terriglobia bacterium]